MSLRHWESACTWERTVSSFDGLAPGQAKEVVAHALEVFLDDVEVGFGQELVNVGNAARRRVLDRDHREAGVTLGHSGEGVAEGLARKRGHRG